MLACCGWFRLREPCYAAKLHSQPGFVDATRGPSNQFTFVGCFFPRHLLIASSEWAWDDPTPWQWHPINLQLTNDSVIYPNAVRFCPRLLVLSPTHKHVQLCEHSLYLCHLIHLGHTSFSDMDLALPMVKNLAHPIPYQCDFRHYTAGSRKSVVL